MDREEKWASEQDRQGALADLQYYGRMVTKNEDGVLHHVPLIDVIEVPDDTK
jgi:hypothetical protein